MQWGAQLKPPSARRRLRLRGGATACAAARRRRPSLCSDATACAAVPHLALHSPRLGLLAAAQCLSTTHALRAWRCHRTVLTAPMGLQQRGCCGMRNSGVVVGCVCVCQGGIPQGLPVVAAACMCNTCGPPGCPCSTNQHECLMRMNERPLRLCRQAAAGQAIGPAGDAASDASAPSAAAARGCPPPPPPRSCLHEVAHQKKGRLARCAMNIITRDAVGQSFAGAASACCCTGGAPAAPCASPGVPPLGCPPAVSSVCSGSVSRGLK